MDAPGLEIGMVLQPHAYNGTDDAELPPSPVSRSKTLWKGRAASAAPEYPLRFSYHLVDTPCPHARLSSYLERMFLYYAIAWRWARH